MANLTDFETWLRTNARTTEPLVPEAKPELSDPSQIRAAAQASSRQIWSSYDKFHDILDRHEATIQKRWLKRTKQQRLKLLLDVLPFMPSSHRPDFQALRVGNEQSPPEEAHLRQAFLLPYINQEDLSKPKPLLLLLNARGRHVPSEFAAMDGDAMHLGIATRSVVPVVLHGYVIMLNWISVAEDYGKLLGRDNHPDAFDWMHTRRQFLPGEGLLVLAAQAKLLGFLLECCSKLLHDIPSAELRSNDHPPQPEPASVYDHGKGGFWSLGMMTEQAPYHLPTKLDLRHIVSLLAAREDAAEDHLWLLREDPSYFAERLLESREHRQELLKDINGETHPVLKPGRESILWTRVIGGVLTEAYLSLEVFAELRRQAEDLCLLQQKYTSVISPSKSLPEEYLFALVKFRHYLKQATEGPLGDLKHSFVASSPMRKYSARHPAENLKDIAVRKSDVKMGNAVSNILWPMRTLWEDGQSLFVARIPAVVDELNHLLQSEPSAQDLISSHIAGIIGNLSIISQCLRQLELYQPWANGFDIAFQDWRDDIQIEFAETTKPWDQMLATFGEKNMTHLTKLGEPTEDKFTYPVKERRTNVNAQALRQAEANLDDFWRKVDQLMHEEAASLDSTAVHRLLSRFCILQRTPQWAEPSSRKCTQTASDPELKFLTEPLSALYFDAEQSISRTVVDAAIIQPPETKAKTRGIAGPSSAADNAESVTHTDDAQTTFPVDARALKVFRTLFFDPSVTSTPGTVSWNDFLHAMTSTGFLAEKLYGSVWHFKPTKLDVQHGIQFVSPFDS